MSLQKLRENLSRELYGMTPAEAHAKGICVDCKEPAEPRCHTENGKKEYGITGMCEKCWDRVFADREDN